jgi:hypothetical protein
MTLVIELEQRIESVAQVDRRANGSWFSLSNAWRLRKSEVRKQVAEEEESFGGRSYRDVDVEERRSERLPSVPSHDDSNRDTDGVRCRGTTSTQRMTSPFDSWRGWNVELNQEEQQ